MIRLPRESGDLTCSMSLNFKLDSRFRGNDELNDCDSI